MRILIINHYAGSPGMGMEFRPYYLARHWEGMGHRVLIVSAGFSHLRRYNPRPVRDFWRVKTEGVEYMFVRTPPYSGNRLGRIANVQAFMAGLIAAAEPLADQFMPGAVISSSTYPFDAIPAQMIAKRAGGVHIHELHDLWPMSLIELYGMSPLNPAMIAMQAAEDFALSRTDRVVSMLPGIGLYMEERGLDKRRFEWIPNGVEPDEPALPPPPDIVDTFWQMRRRYRHIVLYLGGFARANAVGDYLRLASLRPEVLFVAVGDGDEKNALKTRAENKGINNLLFLPPVPHNRVYATLCLADLLYIGARKSPLYRYGVGMNKLYEYMASGRPVLCAIEAMNDPVREAGCGVSVPAQDPRAAAKALDSLLAIGGEARSAMGQRGIEYVARRHTYPALAGSFIEIMEAAAYEKGIII